MTTDAIIPTLSPTRIKALREVAAGNGHTLHGREASGLFHTGLAAPGHWGILELTDRGREVLDTLDERAHADGDL